MKNTIKSFVWIWFIIMGLTVSIFLVWTDNIINEVEEEQALYELYVGETIVIRGDTHIITDYSMVDEIFILDDNTTLAKSFVTKQFK